MASLVDQFRGEIERYLRDSGLDATRFGKQAMNDPRFVFDLRKGKRGPNLRTVEKVREWMRAHPAHRDLRSARREFARRTAALRASLRDRYTGDATADIREDRRR